MDAESHKSQPLLFISHKHVDQRIADVITKFVRMRSAGRVEVYQSSNAWAEGPHIGHNLNKELKEALWRPSVFIMVYTSPDQDWNYCMGECGVASQPQSPGTRIILFQCAGVAPTLFAEQVNVDVRKLSNLQKFTNEFLTDRDFFPRFPGPITQFQRNGQEVAAAAAELYQDLEPILPQPEDPSEEWPAWPFLQLELGLEHVESISKARENGTIEIARGIVQKECLVTQGDHILERLFVAPSFRRGMTFTTLIGIWKGVRPGSKSKWIEALCDQIIEGSQWRFPKMVWELMQGVDDTWYAPVLNRVRRIPSQRCLQFDIYFYKFDVDPGDGSVKVGVPHEELA